MSTIRDVARTAGVSIKTVSRVLNKEGSVRPALREKVEQAVAELGYQPSLAARQMGGKRSYVIGMVMTRPAVSYLPQLAVALSSACAEKGYQFVMEAVEHADRHKAFRSGTQFTNKPDAIILAPRYANDPEMIAAFQAAEIPLVRIEGREGLYGTALNVPDRVAAATLVRHLVDLGHSRIGILAQPLISFAANEKLQGYFDALEAASIERDPKLVVTADFNFNAGVEQISVLLANPDRPTAVFCTSDAMAAGAQSMAQKLGYRIPQDLAICGFNDSPIARATFPPITSVQFSVDELAQAAVDCAINPQLRDFSFSRNLIPRWSTTGDEALCRDPYRY